MQPRLLSEELQVVSAALPVIDALNQRKLEVALAFMTERGFADFCGQQFTSMLQLGLQENAAEKNRELNDIAKKVRVPPSGFEFAAIR